MNYEIKCELCGSKINSSIEMIGYPTQCSVCNGKFAIPLTNFTAGMVSGNYWLQKCIGTGNISQTFVAKRMDDNEKVFLKILSPCVTVVHEDVEQFMIEMCRSHQIDHPNLLSVYETGKMNGHYYLATRFVNGECLDKRIERTGPLSEKEALRLCLKIARILRSCWHDYGIVHRAIKPQNILVNDAGEVFMLDVGNCKQLLISDDVPLERMDNLGTLGDYMSPEEAKGVVDVDCSSDIYSLGATLFFLMTGTKPYVGSDTTQVLLKHLNEPTPSVAQRSGDVTESTAKFIRSMMDSDQDNRIFSWREVVSTLKQLLKSKTLGTGTDRALKTQASTSTDFADEVRTSIMTEEAALPKPFPVIKAAIIAMIAIFVLGVAAATAIFISRKKPKQIDITRKVGNPSGKAIPDKTFKAQISAIKTGIGKGRSSAERQVPKIKRMLKNTDDSAQVKIIKKLIIEAQQKAEHMMKVDLCSVKIGNTSGGPSNGDFEVESFKPWEKAGPGKLQLVADSPKSGKFAVVMNPGAAFRQRSSARKDLANQTVSVSIWGKTTYKGAGVIELRFVTSDGTISQRASRTISGALDYKLFTVTKKAPADCVHLEIYVGF